MPVGAVRTIEELARIGRQRTVADRSVHLRQEEVEADLLLDVVSAARVTLERVSIDGTLTVRSCHIDELVIDHVEADAVLVANSRIGRLTVRNTSVGCELVVTDTSLVSAALHSCGVTRLERLRVEELLQINALRGDVHLTQTRLSALAVKSQVTGGRLGRPRVVARAVRAREDITFDDLWLSTLDLRDVEAQELNLQRVRLDEPLRAAELRCSESVRVNGLVVPADDDSTIRDSTVRGPVEVRGLEAYDGDRGRPDVTACLSLDNSTVTRLTATSREPTVISLRGTSVTDTLGLPGGGSRYSLDAACSVGDMELAGEVFRDGGQIVSFLERSFTEVTGTALESVRSALARRHRNREVDQLYYLTRQREAALLPVLRRGVARGIVGGVLGWGVRARNPVRFLVAGILLTAVALHAAGPLRDSGQGVTDPVSAGKSLLLALALWLNVGTGLPSELKSGQWTALAVAFASAGLLFTTLIVGIVIRKLVR
ncbi:hypothetical protein ACH4KC_12675 [Streptomyces griseoaurantiacus]|uniref:Uncharacterized protein n=1 Tax=Streptomyces griseoaurantiacus TaxID=68213 RepID=A0A1G7JRB9_9ACTN|nr:hypothetical protein [Streptomyces jietaisiensis]SDF26999.1 hypothetical protein SAMN05216260_10724 [Streptomyces jietaisiensis]